MPPKPKLPIKGGNKRKLMIYAGLAAAMVLVFVLVKRGSSSSSSTNATIDPNTGYPAGSAADQQALAAQASASQAAAGAAGGGDLGSGASGVDYSGQLSTIDTDIQTLAQAVSAQQSAAQTPGVTSATGNSDTVTSILGAAQGLFTAGAQAAGAGSAPAPITVNVTAPKQPGPGNTPVVKPGTKLGGGAIEAPSGGKKPAPKPGYTVVGLGGGRWEYKPTK